HLRRMPYSPLKLGVGKNEPNNNWPIRRRIGRSLLLPSIDVRNIEVKLVSPVRLDVDLVLRPDVPVFWDQIHRNDVRRTAWSCSSLLVRRGLAVPSGEPDQVLAGLQPVLRGYLVLSVHN